MADYDLEHGEKKTAKRYFEGIFRADQCTIKSPTRYISASRFRRSSTSPNAAARIQEAHEAERVAILTPEERQKQDQLVAILAGDKIISGSLVDSCLWYGRYLQCKFYHHWHLLAPALVGLEDNAPTPASGDLVIVYGFVIAVAKLLQTRRNLALVDIVDELDNQNMLKPQMDEERAIPNQIVFATLGWLSMLYEAVPDPAPNKLEVIKTSTTSSGFRNSLITKKYYSYKQNFDYIDSPLYELLGRFGELIPHSRPHPTNEPGLARPAEVIKVKDVCFHTLQGLADLKIEWVTSLALHLEMDSSKKTLKLFQFPSFCRMMSVEREPHFLSRLLTDHATRLYEDVGAADTPTEQFFSEILLTYRLIFGQDERSHKAFSRMVPLWKSEQRGRGGTSSCWENPTSWACDPMLLVLCGKSATASDDARRIYDDIDASEPANCYDLNTEFPFFRKRLLELQQFVTQHQPQNLRALLNDRRDVAAWYTIWNSQVLMIFATITILLMALSLVLQAWQVILARQQLQQGRQVP